MTLGRVSSVRHSSLVSLSYLNLSAAFVTMKAELAIRS